MNDEIKPKMVNGNALCNEKCPMAIGLKRNASTVYCGEKGQYCPPYYRAALTKCQEENQTQRDMMQGKDDAIAQLELDCERLKAEKCIPSNRHCETLDKFEKHQITK